jgi:hypothetical protein
MIMKSPLRLKRVFCFLDQCFFFCLDTKETKNQGKTNAPPFCRPAPREQYTFFQTNPKLKPFFKIFLNSNQLNYYLSGSLLLC